MRIFALIAAIATIAFAYCAVPWNGAIPQGWGYSQVPSFVGTPTTPRPLSSGTSAWHPFMAPPGRSTMHADGQSTGTYPGPAPVGRSTEVRSHARGIIGGECATVTFDRHGRIVAVCMNFSGPKLLLMDPSTMEELAGMDLPQRPSMKAGSLRAIVEDTSGGAYFYLDHQDRAVIATSDHLLRIIRVDDTGSSPRFVTDAQFDLGPIVALGKPGDAVTTALPDWNGRIWFVTRGGRIGTLHPDTGQIASIALKDEEIQNSFAVASDGVYIVSDHALYRMKADLATGMPTILWRESYDRGQGRKPGTIQRGSGTTPTLLGSEFVAIADNADPQIRVLVYRRKAPHGERLVCSQEVFPPGRSATENSLIGTGRSLIIENNHGYDIFPTMILGRTSSPGVARVDFDPESGSCRKVWETAIASQTTVPKFSRETGLVYLYTKADDAPLGVDAFYLSALDFETGAVAFQVLSGTGMRHDNNWAPITLGPDGTAYVGVLNGLVSFRDAAP